MTAKHTHEPDYADKDHDVTRPDPAVVFSYAEAYIANGTIAS